MEIRNSQYTTFKSWSVCVIHDICSLSWNLYDRQHTTWLTLTISFNGQFRMRRKETFYEIIFSDIIRFEMSSCWLKVHPLILLYTKLSGLSNDRSNYLNFFDHVFSCGKIWRFLLTNNRKNAFCFSCVNIEYT